MQVEKLRSLIRESINEYIREIDVAAEGAAMEARITKCEEAIQMRESKLENIAESDHKDLIDESKIKGIENEIKVLKKAKAKFEKQREKMQNKKDKKANPEKEVTTDAPVEEGDAMDSMENAIVPEIELEEGSDKQTFKVNNLQHSEKHRPFKKLRREKPGTNRTVPSNQTDNEEDEPFNQGKTKNQPMDETIINESFLKMQKLAGVITEGQYRKKVQILNEVEYAGIKKVPTSGDNYQLTIDAEKWSGQKGGGDHAIALFKNGTLYTTDGSWDWKAEPKSNEVKSLLKKYVEDNKIEKLSPDMSKLLG
jgi:hypothetical protein